MPASSAPVETKVIAGSSASVITGLITWLLVAYVPAFRSGLPSSLAAVLPFVVATVLGTASAYLAPHSPRPAVKGPEHAAR